MLRFWEYSTMQLPEGTSLTRTFSFALTWQHKAFAINCSSRNTSSNGTQQFTSTCQLLSCSDPPTGKVIPQTGLKEASSSPTFSLGLGGLAKVGMVISSSEAEQMSGERSRGLPRANPYLAHMQWDAGSYRWAYGLFSRLPTAPWLSRTSCIFDSTGPVWRETEQDASSEWNNSFGWATQSDNSDVVIYQSVSSSRSLMHCGNLVQNLSRVLLSVKKNYILFCWTTKSCVYKKAKFN